MNNRINSSFSFQSSWFNSSYNSNRLVQNNENGKEFIKFFPPNRSDDLCLLFCLNPSSMTTHLLLILSPYVSFSLSLSLSLSPLSLSLIMRCRALHSGSFALLEPDHTHTHTHTHPPTHYIPLCTIFTFTFTLSYISSL